MNRFLLALVFTSTAFASLAAQQPVFSEALQQEAMTCVGEAAQICPEVLTAEDHGLACMTGRRKDFSPRCRVIYDKVAKVLAHSGTTSASTRRP